MSGVGWKSCCQFKTINTPLHILKDSQSLLKMSVLITHWKGHVWKWHWLHWLSSKHILISNVSFFSSTGLTWAGSSSGVGWGPEEAILAGTKHSTMFQRISVGRTWLARVTRCLRFERARPTFCRDKDDICISSRTTNDFRQHPKWQCKASFSRPFYTRQ